MKIAHRLGLVVAVLSALLLALTGAAVHSLLQLGSAWLAAVVGLAGLVAVAAVGAAYAQARAAERQLGELLPPVLPAMAPLAEHKAAVPAREAHPGEVPAAYLAAVLKGAQATQAAYRARARQP